MPELTRLYAQLDSAEAERCGGTVKFASPFCQLVEFNPGSQLVSPPSAGTNAGDQFGVSVAIDGDTAVVGARFVDNTYSSPPDTGAACIFERNQGGPNNWGEVKRLIGSGDPSVGTQIFGHSVSISGDIVVVGSYLDSSDGEFQAGSAYVFARDEGGAGNWGEVKRLIASDRIQGATFGWSVAVSGNTIVVGARHLSGVNPRGAAYVFDRDQGGTENWGEVKKLNASDVVIQDEFGFSVSMSWLPTFRSVRVIR